VLKRNFVFCILVQLSWVLPVSPCYGQNSDLQARLDRSVQDYVLTADGFAEGLLQLSNEFQIPMGVVWVDSSAARAKLSVSRANATVKEILQAIVDTQPGYQVKVTNGVVHVVATTVSPNQSFLLLGIGPFDVHHELVEMAQQQLRDLVKARFVPSRPGAGGVAGSLISNAGDPRIDVHLVDANVEDVLDALATASSKKIWVVTFTDSLALTATGFRRTASIKNSSPVRDDEQPIWEMFSWAKLGTLGDRQKVF
jgi:hypothetical protein